MAADAFAALVPQMASLSERAVVSLSAWGEPLTHPDLPRLIRTVLMESGLSVLIETDGLLVTEQVCADSAAAVAAAPRRTNGLPPLMWIVSVDACTEETYRAVWRGAPTFLQAQQAVALLTQYFPGDVYPQLMRMDVNEAELEQFYRFWSDSASPSGGKLIIQKYDSYCGVLSDRKPADLSPLGRHPCWHLRRDMTILTDGTVPRCHECYYTHTVGNVFDTSVADVWKKMTLQEDADCGKCDDYYTYNF